MNDLSYGALFGLEDAVWTALEEGADEAVIVAAVREIIEDYHEDER